MYIMSGASKQGACALVAALIAGGSILAGAANAQQIDDPRLDPIFGRRYQEPEQLPPEPTNDDEFSGEKRWKPLRGFVGIMTFLTPETTNLSIGVGPVYRPDYFGSNDYKWAPDPAAYVRFKNFVFLDDDGADLAVFGFSNFAFGPTLRVVGKRKESENPALQGLGDVGTTFEFGGFAATTFLDRFQAKFKVRHGLKTGHRGTIVDARATMLLFRWGPVSTSVSGEASWIGNRYADAYFSVTPEQSMNSGLPVYDAKAGFRDVGGSINGYINIGKHWSLNPYASYYYIFNDIAGTPIIDQFGSREQYRVGFHILKEFSFGRGKRTPFRKHDND